MSIPPRANVFLPILLLATMPFALATGDSATLSLSTSAPSVAPPEPSPDVEPLLFERLQHGPVPLLLHFVDAKSRDAASRLLPEGNTFRASSLLHLPSVDREMFALVQQLDGIRYIEAADKPLQPALTSARHASRADLVTGSDVYGLAGMTDTNGSMIDGRDVGVAIVDSGIDATHPDLVHSIVSSRTVTDAAVLPGPAPDPLSPHGTHVAGIVAGNGTEDPTIQGVAPGVRLHIFDHGPRGTNLHAAQTFDWILAHKDDVDPPIRIVVNAWGCDAGPCRTFDPQQAHNRLATALAENGTIVIFAAGNGGGRGLVSTVNPEATNPTPGIVGVGEQTDDDIGTRATCATKTSSMGALSDPSTWPDAVAPGAWTWSANGVYLGEDSRVPVAERKAYSYFHGTSAAAAHLGGIAALALQVDPTLTPTAFEYLVKAHAEKVPCGLGYVRVDPAHPWGGTHPRMGHGLVDAAAMVRAVLDGFSIPQDEPALETVPEEWLERRQGTDIHHTFYLTHDARMNASAPQGDLPEIFAVSVDAPVVFTSPPLTAEENVSAVRIDLWWGTFAECVCLHFTAPRYGATLEVVHENGTSTPLGEGELNPWYVHPAAPTQRPIDLLFSETQLSAGDRLRLTVAVRTPPSIPLFTTDFLLYADAATTPSRISLGDATGTIHGDPVWCQVRQDCADIGGDRLVEGIHCDSVPMRVEWRGPPGSSIVLGCSAAVLSCTIPLDAPDGSTCTNDLVLNPSQLGEKTGTCRYITMDDSRAGSGRCLGLLPRSSGD